MLFLLLQAFDHLLHRDTLDLGKWASAEQKDVVFILLFPLVEVLVKHAVQLVTEHIEIVDLGVTYGILLLKGLRLEHIFERESAWKQVFVQSVVFHPFQRLHELPVRY